MDKCQAKRHATKWAADVLWGHASEYPPGLLNEDEPNEITDPRDCERIRAALKDLAQELYARSEGVSRGG